MKKSLIILVVVCAICSASFATVQNLISDGDFSSGVLNSIGNQWSSSSDNLNQWYTYSSRGENFYGITQGGYATAATKAQSDRLLLQVIEAPSVGDYNFEFDYRLTDDSDMWGLTRIFAIDDDDADFCVSMTGWAGSFSNVTSADRVYDQGGYDSFVPESSEWANAGGQLTVGDGVDYLVVYSVFSHDGRGSSLRNNVADVDNFVLTSTVPAPEPATVLLLTMGGALAIRRKNSVK